MSSTPAFTEHQLQKTVFDEIEWRKNQNPLWETILAVPNGQYRPGQRMEPGISVGFPDIFVPVARHGYHGAAIELKVGSNRPTKDQRAWHRRLRAEGYYVTVIRDNPETVMATLEWFLFGSEDPTPANRGVQHR